MNPDLKSRVEDAGLNASAPPAQRWLDGWLLRLSAGKAKRARCINALAAGRLTFSERLRGATEAYREAGLPLIMRITPFTQPVSLDADLAQLGWRRFDDTRVMLWPSYQVSRAVDLAPESVTPAEFAAIVGALRGSAAAQIDAHAVRLQASSVNYQGYVVRRAGAVLACGQLAREGDLVGLYDVFTAADTRGQGLATALCRWLLQAAHDQGARHAYLQVEGDNAPARAIYHRLGFTDAYAYHYRTPESGAV